MRELFVSELRYIQNILMQNLAVALDPVPSVVSEYHAPPTPRRKGPTFNRDFVLRFATHKELPKHQSYCSRILPNASGSEVFITVDAHTRQPFMTELVSGEAFGPKYYKQFIQQLEAEVERLQCKLLIEECNECRLFVINYEICFLLSVVGLCSAVEGEKTVLRNDNDARIVSYSDNGKLVCVDGWLKTQHGRSDWTLMAE